MSVDGFCELTLQAGDLPALEAFYTEHVGLACLTRADDRVWLRVGPHARLGLWAPGPKEFGDEGGAHVHFALSVDPGGLDALRERLEQTGIAVRGPVEHPGGDRSIYFEDPEGNVVEAWDFFGRERPVEALADPSGDRLPG